MKNNVNNIIKTLCGRLQFLQLSKVFMRFLTSTQSLCNLLIYSELVGGHSLVKEKFTKMFIQNIMFKQKINQFYVL
jgi:hypothetical protein